MIHKADQETRPSPALIKAEAWREHKAAKAQGLESTYCHWLDIIAERFAYLDWNDCCRQWARSEDRNG